MLSANMRNLQRVKYEMKMWKLVYVLKEQPKIGVVYNLNENVKPMT